MNRDNNSITPPNTKKSKKGSGFGFKSIFRKKKENTSEDEASANSQEYLPADVSRKLNYDDETDSKEYSVQITESGNVELIQHDLKIEDQTLDMHKSSEILADANNIEIKSEKYSIITKPSSNYDASATSKQQIPPEKVDNESISSSLSVLLPGDYIDIKSDIFVTKLHPSEINTPQQSSASSTSHVTGSYSSRITDDIEQKYVPQNIEKISDSYATFPDKHNMHIFSVKHTPQNFATALIDKNNIQSDTTAGSDISTEIPEMQKMENELYSLSAFRIPNILLEKSQINYNRNKLDESDEKLDTEHNITPEIIDKLYFPLIDKEGKTEEKISPDNNPNKRLLQMEVKENYAERQVEDITQTSNKILPESDKTRIIQKAYSLSSFIGREIEIVLGKNEEICQVEKKNLEKKLEEAKEGIDYEVQTKLFPEKISNTPEENFVNEFLHLENKSGIIKESQRPLETILKEGKNLNKNLQQIENKIGLEVNLPEKCLVEKLLQIEHKIEMSQLLPSQEMSNNILDENQPLEVIKNLSQKRILEKLPIENKIDSEMVSIPILPSQEINSMVEENLSLEVTKNLSEKSVNKLMSCLPTEDARGSVEDNLPLDDTKIFQKKYFGERLPNEHKFETEMILLPNLWGNKIEENLPLEVSQNLPENSFVERISIENKIESESKLTSSLPSQETMNGVEDNLPLEDTKILAKKYFGERLSNERKIENEMILLTNLWGSKVNENLPSDVPQNLLENSSAERISIENKIEPERKLISSLSSQETKSMVKDNLPLESTKILSKKYFGSLSPIEWGSKVEENSPLEDIKVIPKKYFVERLPNEHKIETEMLPLPSLWGNEVEENLPLEVPQNLPENNFVEKLPTEYKIEHVMIRLPPAEIDNTPKENIKLFQIEYKNSLNNLSLIQHQSLSEKIPQIEHKDLSEKICIPQIEHKSLPEKIPQIEHKNLPEKVLQNQNISSFKVSQNYTKKRFVTNQPFSSSLPDIYKQEKNTDEQLRQIEYKKIASKAANKSDVHLENSESISKCSSEEKVSSEMITKSYLPSEDFVLYSEEEEYLSEQYDNLNEKSSTEHENALEIMKNYNPSEDFENMHEGRFDEKQQIEYKVATEFMSKSYISSDDFVSCTENFVTAQDSFNENSQVAYKVATKVNNKSYFPSEDFVSSSEDIVKMEEENFDKNLKVEYQLATGMVNKSYLLSEDFVLSLEDFIDMHAESFDENSRIERDAISKSYLLSNDLSAVYENFNEKLETGKKNETNESHLVSEYSSLLYDNSEKSQIEHTSVLQVIHKLNIPPEESENSSNTEQSFLNRQLNSSAEENAELLKDPPSEDRAKKKLPQIEYKCAIKVINNPYLPSEDFVSSEHVTNLSDLSSLNTNSSQFKSEEINKSSLHSEEDKPQIEYKPEAIVSTISTEEQLKIIEHHKIVEGEGISNTYPEEILHPLEEIDRGSDFTPEIVDPFYSTFDEIRNMIAESNLNQELKQIEYKNTSNEKPYQIEFKIPEKIEISIKKKKLPGTKIDNTVINKSNFSENDQYKAIFSTTSTEELLEIIEHHKIVEGKGSSNTHTEEILHSSKEIDRKSDQNDFTPEIVNPIYSTSNENTNMIAESYLIQELQQIGYIDTSNEKPYQIEFRIPEKIEISVKKKLSGTQIDDAAMNKSKISENNENPVQIEFKIPFESFQMKHNTQSESGLEVVRKHSSKHSSQVRFKKSSITKFKEDSNDYKNEYREDSNYDEDDDDNDDYEEYEDTEPISNKFEKLKQKLHDENIPQNIETYQADEPIKRKSERFHVSKSVEFKLLRKKSSDTTKEIDRSNSSVNIKKWVDPQSSSQSEEIIKIKSTNLEEIDSDSEVEDDNGLEESIKSKFENYKRKINEENIPQNVVLPEMIREKNIQTEDSFLSLMDVYTVNVGKNLLTPFTTKENISEIDSFDTSSLMSNEETKTEENEYCLESEDNHKISKHDLGHTNDEISYNEKSFRQSKHEPQDIENISGSDPNNKKRQKKSKENYYPEKRISLSNVRESEFDNKNVQTDNKEDESETKEKEQASIHKYTSLSNIINAKKIAQNIPQKIEKIDTQAIQSKNEAIKPFAWDETKGYSLSNIPGIIPKKSKNSEIESENHPEKELEKQFSGYSIESWIQTKLQKYKPGYKTIQPLTYYSEQYAIQNKENVQKVKYQETMQIKNVNGIPQFANIRHPANIEDLPKKYYTEQYTLERIHVPKAQKIKIEEPLKIEKLIKPKFTTIEYLAKVEYLPKKYYSEKYTLERVEIVPQPQKIVYNEIMKIKKLNTPLFTKIEYPVNTEGLTKQYYLEKYTLESIEMAPQSQKVIHEETIEMKNLPPLVAAEYYSAKSEGLAKKYYSEMYSLENVETVPQPQKVINERTKEIKNIKTVITEFCYHSAKCIKDNSTAVPQSQKVKHENILGIVNVSTPEIANIEYTLKTEGVSRNLYTEKYLSETILKTMTPQTVEVEDLDNEEVFNESIDSASAPQYMENIDGKIVEYDQKHKVISLSDMIDKLSSGAYIPANELLKVNENKTLNLMSNVTAAAVGRPQFAKMEKVPKTVAQTVTYKESTEKYSEQSKGISNDPHARAYELTADTVNKMNDTNNIPENEKPKDDNREKTHSLSNTYAMYNMHAESQEKEKNDIRDNTTVSEYAGEVVPRVNKEKFEETFTIPKFAYFQYPVKTEGLPQKYYTGQYTLERVETVPEIEVQRVKYAETREIKTVNTPQFATMEYSKDTNGFSNEYQTKPMVQPISYIESLPSKNRISVSAEYGGSEPISEDYTHSEVSNSEWTVSEYGGEVKPRIHKEKLEETSDRPKFAKIKYPLNIEGLPKKYYSELYTLGNVKVVPQIEPEIVQFDEHKFISLSNEIPLPGKTKKPDQAKLSDSKDKCTSTSGLTFKPRNDKVETYSIISSIASTKYRVNTEDFPKKFYTEQYTLGKDENGPINIPQTVEFDESEIDKNSISSTASNNETNHDVETIETKSEFMSDVVEFTMSKVIDNYRDCENIRKYSKLMYPVRIEYLPKKFYASQYTLGNVEDVKGAHIRKVETIDYLSLFINTPEKLPQKAEIDDSIPEKPRYSKAPTFRYMETLSGKIVEYNIPAVDNTSRPNSELKKKEFSSSTLTYAENKTASKRPAFTFETEYTSAISVFDAPKRASTHAFDEEFIFELDEELYEEIKQTSLLLQPTTERFQNAASNKSLTQKPFAPPLIDSDNQSGVDSNKTYDLTSLAMSATVDQARYKIKEIDLQKLELLDINEQPKLASNYSLEGSIWSTYVSLTHSLGNKESYHWMPIYNQGYNKEELRPLPYYHTFGTITPETRSDIDLTDFGDETVKVSYSYETVNKDLLENLLSTTPISKTHLLDDIYLNNLPRQPSSYSYDKTIRTFCIGDICDSYDIDFTNASNTSPPSLLQDTNTRYFSKISESYLETISIETTPETVPPMAESSPLPNFIEKQLIPSQPLNKLGISSKKYSLSSILKPQGLDNKITSQIVLEESFTAKTLQITSQTVETVILPPFVGESYSVNSMQVRPAETESEKDTLSYVTEQRPIAMKTKPTSKLKSSSMSQDVIGSWIQTSFDKKSLFSQPISTKVYSLSSIPQQKEKIQKVSPEEILPEKTKDISPAESSKLEFSKKISLSSLEILSVRVESSPILGFMEKQLVLPEAVSKLGINTKKYTMQKQFILPETISKLGKHPKKYSLSSLQSKITSEVVVPEEMTEILTPSTPYYWISIIPRELEIPKITAETQSIRPIEVVRKTLTEILTPNKTITIRPQIKSDPEKKTSIEVVTKTPEGILPPAETSISEKLSPSEESEKKVTSSLEVVTQTLKDIPPERILKTKQKKSINLKDLTTKLSYASIDTNIADWLESIKEHPKSGPSQIFGATETMTIPPNIRASDIVALPEIEIITSPEIIEKSPEIYKPPKMVISIGTFKATSKITPRELITLSPEIFSPKISTPLEIITAPNVIIPPEIITITPEIYSPKPSSPLEIITASNVITPPEIITLTPEIYSPKTNSPQEIITASNIIGQPEMITISPELYSPPKINIPQEIFTFSNIIEPPIILSKSEIIAPIGINNKIATTITTPNIILPEITKTNLGTIITPIKIITTTKPSKEKIFVNLTGRLIELGIIPKDALITTKPKTADKTSTVTLDNKIKQKILFERKCGCVDKSKCRQIDLALKRNEQKK